MTIRTRQALTSALASALLLHLLVGPTRTWGYETDAHAKMTELAAEPDIEEYISDLYGPVEQRCERECALEQMRTGSIQEDAFINVNDHFHNPLDNEGLRATIRGDQCLDRFCFVGSISGRSTPVYFLAGTSKTSWGSARDLLGDVIAGRTRRERDRSSREMFRALGHLVHLLQDQASSFHVRNDPHPEGQGFGLLVERPALDHHVAEPDVVEGIHNRNPPVNPEDGLLEMQSALGLGNPISNLFDINHYTSNSQCSHPSGTVGISEYAASHFVSARTLLAVDGRSVCPAPSDFLACPDDRCTYFPPDQIRPILQAEVDPATGRAKYTEAVARDHVEMLIPEAIGYSHEMLEYFFRGVGQLEIALVKRLIVVRNMSEDTLYSGVLAVYSDEGGARKPVLALALPQPLVPGRAFVILPDFPAAGGSPGPVDFVEPWPIEPDDIFLARPQVSVFTPNPFESNGPFVATARFIGAMGRPGAAPEPHGVASRTCELESNPSSSRFGLCIE